MRIDEILKKIDDKWAIVSKTNGRVLRWFKGEGKPSEEWVKAQEAEINYFKHKDDK